MKATRFFRILAVAVILALLMVAVPATTVSAAAGVTISPGNGVVGATVTVSGIDLTDGEGYQVTFAYGTAFAQVVASGIISGTTLTKTFSVPTAPRGAYTVRTTTSLTAPGYFDNTFTVTPKITLDDTTGNVGDTVSVDGTGFAASATVTIYYDSTSLGTKTTGTGGTFDNFTFTVPASTEGSHNVYGHDTSGNSPNVSYEVSPEITINPTTGAVGDTVTVTGTGFAASEDIDITFDGATVSSAADTNTSGSFPATTFQVPSTSRGSHTVKAEDESSNDASATFTVSASITLTPPNGSAGTIVTVTGTGFGSVRTVTISYNAQSVVTSPASVTTNSAGYFSATFTVPAGLAGTYVVQAGDGINTATAGFTSTTDATISPVTSAASPGYVGMPVTITGIGFTPSGTATVRYYLGVTEYTDLASVPINPSGSFTANFEIPPSAGGAHSLTVSDGPITKSFTFIMETAAPPTPEITLPLADTKLKDNTFEWDAVADGSQPSNPVTYDLQVASDDTFSEASLLLDKTGLAETSYTLLDAEKLESTNEEAPYYWHVRAVDAASNASGWSEATAFTVGWSFEFAGWVVYVTMAVIAIAFFFIGLAVGRRGGGGGYYY